MSTAPAAEVTVVVDCIFCRFPRKARRVQEWKLSRGKYPRVIRPWGVPHYSTASQYSHELNYGLGKFPEGIMGERSIVARYTPKIKAFRCIIVQGLHMGWDVRCCIWNLVSVEPRLHSDTTFGARLCLPLPLGVWVVQAHILNAGASSGDWTSTQHAYDTSSDS